MYKGHFNITAFNKARVAQSVEHRTNDFRVVGLNPTVGKIFIILYFVAFDANLAGRLFQYK